MYESGQSRWRGRGREPETTLNSSTTSKVKQRNAFLPYRVANSVLSTAESLVPFGLTQGTRALNTTLDERRRYNDEL